MKYYYGNDYKEALSNDPVEIETTKALRSYQDHYNVVIPVDEITEEYTCAVCGEVFEKGASDDEAHEELEENFPGSEEEDCELVCDDCYKKIMEGK